MSMYICVPCTCSVDGFQEKASDPLEMEAQAVSNCPVCAGNRTAVLQEQQVLVAAKPPFQLPKAIF